ncbi:hypothetical protein HHI36_005007 [Cryptolaemus montrouzieri]|uniref:Death-inducer obliterator 1 n=1 Tax=Cryptolaemus montrouzieri TaxID=559131 RepID=A0ABD2NSW7_9CUCU
MANSVVTVTDAMLNDSLLLLVGEDGTVTPDRETVETYLNSKTGTTNIRLMHINKTDKKGIDISIDHLTYVPDVINEVEVSIPTNKEGSEMDEIARNLYNFRLDHDYTSFESTLKLEEPPQLEDLVNTLEEDKSETPLNGEEVTDLPPPSLIKAVETLPTTSTPVESTILVNEPQQKPTPTKGKAKVINIEKQVASKGSISRTSDRAKLKEKPKIVQQIVDEFDDDYDEDDLENEDEDYDCDDDDNDSDFELEGPTKIKAIKKNQARRKSQSKTRTPKTESKSDHKQTITESHTPKSKEQKSKILLKNQTQELTPELPKVEKQQENSEPDKLTLPGATEKKTHKKEKRPPKPIPNDFMLFSTPDIIRRVGKDPPTPTLTDNPTNISSAKITSENRSKSLSVEQSPQNQNKSNRLSCDSKLSEKQINNKLEKSEIKSKDRRPSLEKNRKNSIDKRSKSSPSDSEKDNSSKSNKPIVLQNIHLSGSMEHLSMETMPTPEDIRSIIMTEDVKSYTTSTLPLIQTSEISSTEAVDQNIGLDTSSLDIDQSILDNINSDEISEDILYQVAQSLVGNTDLQNAIDKGLNEGNLILDPSMQESIVPQAQSQHSEVSQNKNQQQSESDIIKKGTQIVRPDGRIVVIPPIERPTTRSRNRQKAEEPQLPKAPIKPLDNEHVSGNELDSSDDENNQEDESEDDPNKLWCICNQPHNNRFMICCDTCEEWYHGKCVNITKVMGQQMEEEGREWICLFCKDPTLKRPQAAARRIRKASRASTDSAESSKKVEKNQQASNQVTCIVCHKPARENSIYCSQTCILTHASGVERVVVFEKSTGRMLSGNKAPSSATLEQWLRDHPTFEVYRSGGKIVTSKVPQKHQTQPKQQQPNLTQSKLKIVKNTEDHGVSLEVRKRGLKVGVLKHMPKHDESLKTEIKSPSVKPTGIKSDSGPIQKFYAKTAVTPGTKKPEVTPTKAAKPVTSTTPSKPKLVQSTIKTTPSTTPKDKSQPVKTPKARQSEQQTTPQSTPKQQENIRENVQKTLFEQLTNRMKLDGNLKLKEEEVKEISTEIESQLFKCFGDTGQKYRNKYRSLIFNIKDIKNQTLWKRICEKSINAYQLVRLSPDDLASQELALWREREAKHSLDMIKKSELELLNCSRQYVLKTHKGEQVVDEENRPGDKVDNAEVIRTLTEDHSSDGKDSKSDTNKDSQKKGSSKHSHRDRDKDRKTSRDRTNTRDHKKRRRSTSKERDKSKDRDRSKRRSSSKDRSSISKKDRKRSRSRDRHRKSSHKSSRHKKDISHISSTDKLDKKSKEILEQLVDNKIVPPLEDRLWKHVPQEDVVPGPAESDSDHEPSSTVTIPTPPHTMEGDDQGSQSLETKIVKTPEVKEPEVERSMSPPLSRKQPGEIWHGTISMIDVAHISITAHEVSGDCTDLGEQLPPNLDIVGRISLDTVWDYIGKMKCSNSKIISLVRLNAVNVVEKMPYLALYSYLSSRKRLGVVKSTNKAIKDFYVLPLAPQKPIPQALLPLNGPGFEESRPALLLGIIVRDKRKRGSTDPTPTYSSLTPKKLRVITPPLPMGTPPYSVDTPATTDPPRSYTPPSVVSTPPLPVNKDPRMKITIPPPPPIKEVDDGDEPYSPEDSDPDTSLIVGTSFTEPPPVLVNKPPLPTMSVAPSFPYAPIIPGLDVGTPLPASTLEIQKQMEELNKKIEAQKSEIHSISKNIVSASTEIGQSALANIALPSNLQQILDSIKTISTDGGVEESTTLVKPADSNLTIPLLLPKSFSRPLSLPPPPVGITKVDFPTNTIPLNLPTKTKLKLSATNSPHGSDSPGLLSSLSEEELVKKAAEMLGETDLSPPPKEKSKSSTAPFLPAYSVPDNTSAPQTKRQKLDNEQVFDIEPPIPGVDN